MKNKIKGFALSISLFIAPASEAIAAPGWSDPLTIQSFIPGEGIVNIIVPSGHTNSQNCANSVFLSSWTISPIIT